MSASNAVGTSGDTDEAMACPLAASGGEVADPDYGYDGDGLRAFKRTGSPTTGARTYFLYDGETPVAEMDSTGSVTATNTFGPTGLLSRHTTTGGSAFYAFDPQGSAAARLDGTGTVLAYYTLDAYGAHVGTDASDDPYSGFGGQWGYFSDSETGLELLTHRYYDVSTGRFVTRDPISYSGGVNLYSYTTNNPINAIDPTGYSQDVGGGSGTLRLSWTAFIPTSTTLGGYGGDNRGFSASSSRYRLEQNIMINLQKGLVRILPGRVGASHHGPLTDTASNDGMTGHYTRDNCGNYHITIDGAVSNPLFADEFGFNAPPIKYHVNILVDSQGHVLNWSGTHSGYPAFELYSYQNGMPPDGVFYYKPTGSPLDLFKGVPFAHNP